MLQIGDNISETTVAANRDIATIISWGQENAISFDPGKTEVMHFSNRAIELLSIQYGEVQKIA